MLQYRHLSFWWFPGLKQWLWSQICVHASALQFTGCANSEMGIITTGLLWEHMHLDQWFTLGKCSVNGNLHCGKVGIIIYYTWKWHLGCRFRVYLLRIYLYLVCRTVKLLNLVSRCAIRNKNSTTVATTIYWALNICHILWYVCSDQTLTTLWGRCYCPLSTLKETQTPTCLRLQKE